MSKKPWQSQTILGAVGTLILALYPIVVDSIENNKFPSEAEVLAVAGLLFGGTSTILGRLKAKERVSLNPEVKPLILDIPGAVEETNILSRPLSVSYDTNISQAPVEDDLVESSDSEEESELSVDLDNLEDARYYFVCRESTRIKTSIKDSTVLEKEQKMDLIAAQVVHVDGWKYIDEANHISVTINGTDYFVYVPHIDLYNLENKVIEIEGNASNGVVINHRKTPVNFPGYTQTFYLEDSVIPNGHFTWSEATKGGTRLPENQNVVQNIIRIAKELEGVRELFGNKPITITSWYRPPHINRRVGGASRSKHLEGHAVDLRPVGMNLSTAQRMLEDYWKKGGFGRGARKGFLHIDLGPYRVWNY